MNSQEVHQLKETTEQVHRSLTDALVSLRFIMANFEAFPPERRAALEAEWQRMHWQAIEHLRASLALFKRHSSLPLMRFVRSEGDARPAGD